MWASGPLAANSDRSSAYLMLMHLAYLSAFDVSERLNMGFREESNRDSMAKYWDHLLISFGRVEMLDLSAKIGLASVFFEIFNYTKTHNIPALKLR